MGVRLFSGQNSLNNPQKKEIPKSGATQVLLKLYGKVYVSTSSCIGYL